MNFDRVTIESTPLMVVSEPGEPMIAAPRAFARLESGLPSMHGRKFYGWVDVGSREYRACVILRDGDDPAALGFEPAVLPGGNYLRGRLRGEPKEIYAQIGETFDVIARVAGALDPSRPFIEFYRRRDEIDLLVPILA